MDESVPGVAYPVESMGRMVEGEVYRVVVDGVVCLAQLVQRDGSWYFFFEDGGKLIPVVSLWWWCALSSGRYWVGEVSGVTHGGVLRVGAAMIGADGEVGRVMADPSVVLVDIRYAARGRWRHEWDRGALRARFGSRYTHERGLANANFQDREKSVALVNAEKALAGAVDLLSKGFSLLLLCGCNGDNAQCSCRKVEALIVERFRQVQKPRTRLQKMGDWFPS